MTRFVRNSVPIWLLVLLVLSFGPFIPWLGFYWDDWPVILTGRLQGAAGFWQFYQYDRPISAWTYAVTFPLLGSKPLNWHVFTLLLRWGTAVSLWWTLVRLWPEHRRESSWVAVLFSIYPVFTQQSISVAYSQHWICYLLFIFSLGAMVEAWRVRQGRSRLKREGWSWLFSLLALFSSLLHLLTMEYFAGLELLRPVLLWLLVSPAGQTLRKKMLFVVRAWLPYLVTLAGFTIWRLFFLQFPGEDANSPSLLLRIAVEPAGALLRLAQIAVQDTLHLFVSVWANILAPLNFDLTDHFSLFSWGWTLLVAGTTLVLLRQRVGENEIAAKSSSNWSHQALVTGSAAVLFGMLPVWFTDRQIIVGAYSNRFGLPAMLGCSLVVVAVMEGLVSKNAQRIALLSLLVGLAAGAHMRTANDYRWSWVRQTRFYWNLAWRAPGLQPGTAILSDGEIFPYVGIYSTAAGINLLYQTGETTRQLPYWFHSLGREYAFILDSFLQGMPLETRFRQFTFHGNSKDVLVVLYQPSDHDCLEVLTPEDDNAPGIPGITAAAASNSNLSRILAVSSSGPPSSEIFGREHARGWCYLYEKADLARQFEDWEEVARLGDQAWVAGYTPLTAGSDTAFEWMPFIEGYARMGRLQEAKEISLEAFGEDEKIAPRMCRLWEKIRLAVPAGKQDADEVGEKLGCSW